MQRNSRKDDGSKGQGFSRSAASTRQEALGGCWKSWILMRLLSSFVGTVVPNFFEISRSRHHFPVPVGGDSRGARVATTGSSTTSSSWPHSFRGRCSPCPRRRLDQRNRRPMHPFGTPRL